MLNNEMDDFAAKPGVPNGFRLVGADANAIAPGKRPLSSMTPTFVEKPRRRDDRSARRAAATSWAWCCSRRSTGWTACRPRNSSSRAAITTSTCRTCSSFEPGALTDEEKQTLQKYGHTLRESRQPGNMQIVTWDYRSGEVKAVSDPRGVGVGWCTELLVAGSCPTYI